MGEPNRQRLLRSLDGLPITLAWHRPDLGRIRSARPGEQFAVSTYARLLMPELIDEPHVVYLDGDVLVLDDVGVLFDLPIAPFAALAVTDPTGAGHLADAEHLPAALREAHPAARYANTGILPIDLDDARRTGFTDDALALLTELPGRPKWVDQDLICVVLADRIGPLPARWNAYANVFIDIHGPSHLPADEQAEAHDHPAIVHYTLDSKPWRRKCPHPMQAQWFEAVDRTAWRGFRPNYWNDPPDWRARLARMRRHR
ncbi:MAG: glycosyltransferase [Ilumatobacteraceae bacterium]